MGSPVIYTVGVLVDVFITYWLYAYYSLLSIVVIHTFMARYARLRDIYPIVGDTSSDATTKENQPNQKRSKIKSDFQSVSLSELPAVSLTATR